MRGLSAIRVRLDGDAVVVECGDAYRRVWPDVVALTRDEQGRMRVLAVGERPEQLRAVPFPLDEAPHLRELLDRTEFRPALSPERFDPDLALTLLSEAVAAVRRAVPWWRRVVAPRLAIEIPGFERVPEDRRRLFGERLAALGHASVVNGRDPADG